MDNRRDKKVVGMALRFVAFVQFRAFLERASPKSVYGTIK
jgi:hypothetical protein